MTVAESSVCCSYNLCSVLLVVLNLNRVLVLTKDGLLKSYAVKSNGEIQSIKEEYQKCKFEMKITKRKQFTCI